MAQSDPAAFDNHSDHRFVDYYEHESLRASTRQRFEAILDRVVRLAQRSRRIHPPFSALDIGCGPGMQSILWASAGHRACGIDVNASLIDVARKRAQSAGLDVRFDVGSATALPYDDASFDVCLMPEILEHVPDWQSCLNEATRVLRPGGILYTSTTNYLCPMQSEFNLPLYSWYPSPLKRRYERLAVSTRPELVNYARYPAVNWFSYYGLARFLGARGLICFDRFDMIDPDSSSGVRKSIIQLIRKSRLLRFFGHALTPASIIFAVKQ